MINRIIFSLVIISSHISLAMDFSSKKDWERAQWATEVINSEIREEIREMLQRGEVNSRVRDTGHTLLTWSFLHDKSLFEQLLKAGADPEIPQDNEWAGQFTVLMLAAEKYDLNALEYLSAAGAKINTQNDCGLTALTCLLNQLRFHEKYLSRELYKKSYKCVKFLLKSGADLSLKVRMFGEEKYAIDLACEMKSDIALTLLLKQSRKIAQSIQQ